PPQMNLFGRLLFLGGTSRREGEARPARHRRRSVVDLAQILDTNSDSHRRFCSSYFARLATKSSLANSPTWRLNLISSPEILPLYTTRSTWSSYFRFSTKEISSPLTEPSTIWLSLNCDFAVPVNFSPSTWKS